jgi:hypothetical protein
MSTSDTQSPEVDTSSLDGAESDSHGFCPPEGLVDRGQELRLEIQGTGTAALANQCGCILNGASYGEK